LIDIVSNFILLENLLHHKKQLGVAMGQKYQFRGVIRYEDVIVCDFKTEHTIDAIAKVTALLTNEYPYSQGEVSDLATGAIIYQCRQSAIC
jgi:hypothetical protein